MTCFHTFVFAAHPVLLVVGSNVGVLPTDGAAVARALAASAAITAALLLGLRGVVPDLRARTAYLSLVFIACGLYGTIAGDTTHSGTALLYVVAVCVLAAIIVRPWAVRPRTSTPWNIAACALLAVNAGTIVPAARASGAWQQTADDLIDEVLRSGARPPDSARPSIYYIVLDGFGRPDVLQDLYDLDLEPFVTALESRGFVLPSAGRSNYAQTYLSLASSLNLSYLDDIAREMRGSADRRVLAYLIQHNALMRLAGRAGYQVSAVGSNYSATMRLDRADTCLCEQYGLSETEVTLLGLTPLRALPLERWTYGAHRRKLVASFRHLERAADGNHPTLVFAHMVAPHPPFVFDADGSARPGAKRTFGFHDGSHYAGSSAEYVAGYREQTRFVAREVLAAVDAILSRPGPAPVIVLQADHGPASTWNWDHLHGANVRERLSIFSAYRLPGDEPADVPAQISPVNGLRLVANRYLGTALPALPDRSFASTWGQPFELVPVAPDDDVMRAPHGAARAAQP